MRPRELAWMATSKAIKKEGTKGTIVIKVHKVGSNKVDMGTIT